MVFSGRDVRDGICKSIVVEAGVIQSIQVLDHQQKEMPWLSSGFIDMQVNGYLGIDYSGDDLTPSGIMKLIKALAKTGTLHHVPTIITNSEERIEKNLKIISDTVKNDEIARNAILGIHVEGPYISSKDGPRGAHDPIFVRSPNIEEVLRWQTAACGLVKIITIAPETNGAVVFTKAINKMGILVSVGHCEPTFHQLEAVIAAGAKLSTHLGNGSSSLLPRLKNHIWMQLADDRLTAGIISDGFHLPSYVLKCFKRTKGIDHLILVSDVALLGGLQPGFSKWGNINVEICPDGHLGLPGTDLLAGAGHLLDWDIRVFMESTGANLAESIRTVTLNPARILGLDFEEKGFCEGAPADLVEFYLGNERLVVSQYCLGSFCSEV